MSVRERYLLWRYTSGYRRKWWQWRKNRKVDDVVDFTKGLFEGWTIEEIEQFNAEALETFRNDQAELTEEIKQYSYGTEEHRHCAYRLYCLGLHLDNNARMDRGELLNYLLTQEQFEKVYYGKGKR